MVCSWSRFNSHLSTYAIPSAQYCTERNNGSPEISPGPFLLLRPVVPPCTHLTYPSNTALCSLPLSIFMLDVSRSETCMSCHIQRNRAVTTRAELRLCDCGAADSASCGASGNQLDVLYALENMVSSHNEWTAHMLLFFSPPLQNQIIVSQRSRCVLNC